MSSPEADEVLFAYIAVALHAVSLELIRMDNDIQWPVYYVSKSLHKAEIRYLLLEIWRSYKPRESSPTIFKRTRLSY